ncbi:MAG: D-aminoacyl-tRNA deacylase, partial [uncultured Rubrobacteraceae bacterium]
AHSPPARQRSIRYGRWREDLRHRPRPPVAGRRRRRRRRTRSGLAGREDSGTENHGRRTREDEPQRQRRGRGHPRRLSIHPPRGHTQRKASQLRRSGPARRSHTPLRLLLRTAPRSGRGPGRDRPLRRDDGRIARQRRPRHDSLGKPAACRRL